MPRKPIGPQAMTSAQRKREQRSRDRTMIMECDDEQWPERVCLLVLSGSYADAYKKAAWQQLGRIHGWIE